MPNFKNFEIIAGTYEEYLLGYYFSAKEKTLVQSIASHDHSGSIRSLASCDQYLASGATDDRIIIYDLKSRKEQCMLTHHDSTVTSLAFTHNHSHIISASQDGSLAIVRVGNWQLEKWWEQPHKGGTILDIAVHSSGKLALTLGTDCTIRTWNLIKGRAAYIINLYSKCRDPKSLEKILFGPDDIKFALYGGKYTEIWSIEQGGMLEVLEHDVRVTCCAWIDSDTIFVGYEDGKAIVWNLETKEELYSKQAHTGRIKAAQYFEGFIITASSSGEIKVWSDSLEEVTSIKTDCRITCLRVVQWNGVIKKEETEEMSNTEPVIRTQPQKSTVIVEVDDSSDEGSVAAKKRKKKQSNSGTKKKNAAKGLLDKSH